MKALVKTKKGPDAVVLMDVQKPVINADELLIRIHAGGICGTDMHILKDEYEACYPVVMGHEYSGVVEEVGDDVRAFQKGDRVISLTAAVTCGTCEFCRQELLMLCDARKSIGSGVDGAFAEYMKIPAKLTFHIPENVSMDVAALAEPLACVVRGVVEMSAVKGGDFVYVSGPGAIGQLTAQVAKVCGAHVSVAGTDQDAERLAVAKRLGADEIINVSTEDAAQRMMQITRGRGYDVVYECAGSPYSAQTCLRLVRKTGQYSQVGLYGAPVPFDHDLALKKEVHVVNSFASERSSWEIAIRLMERGVLRLDELISDKLPLEQWEQAFQKVENKEGFKLLLTMD